jgi:hypothetical protein
MAALVKSVEKVELSGDENFEKAFVRCLGF